MALDTKKLPSTGGNRVEQPDLEAGVYPARVVQIIDFGLQPQRPYKGQEKPPAYEIGITYELVDAFMIDEDGEELLDKPRWVSENMPVYNLSADLAKSTRRYKALDPTEEFDGNFGMLTDIPCNVTIVLNKKGDKTYTNVADVGPMRPRDAAKCPELVNEPRVFDLSNPDLEVFNAFPKWIQEKITSNLEYKGSKLESLLGDQPEAVEEKPKRKSRKPAPEVEEEPPFDTDEEIDNSPY